MGFPEKGTLVWSGTSFQKVTAAVLSAPENSQTVHHGGVSQAVGSDTAGSSTIPGRSRARIQSPAAAGLADMIITCPSLRMAQPVLSAWITFLHKKHSLPKNAPCSAWQRDQESHMLSSTGKWAAGVTRITKISSGSRK